MSGVNRREKKWSTGKGAGVVGGGSHNPGREEKRAGKFAMAPAMSKPCDFAAIHRKRESAPAVSFDAESKPTVGGVSWGLIVEVR